MISMNFLDYLVYYLPHTSQKNSSMLNILTIKKIMQKEVELGNLVNKMMASLNNYCKQFYLLKKTQKLKASVGLKTFGW